MAEWIPLTQGFIAADVIRWQEAVFASSGRRSRKPLKIGSRFVTAEVLAAADRNGWVRVLVRACLELSGSVGRTIEIYRTGTELKRAQRTILRGKPERLLWSDESARSVVASQTISEDAPAIPRAPRYTKPKRRTGSRGSTSRKKRTPR